MTKNIMMSGTRVRFMMMMVVMMVTRIDLTNMKMTKHMSKTIINHSRSPPDAQEYNDDRHEGESDDDHDDHGGVGIRLAIIIMMIR